MSDPNGSNAAGGSGPGAMLAEVLAGISRLVQGELALARAEAAERLGVLRQSLVQAMIAVVLGIAAINVLAGAAVAAAVAAGLHPAWAGVLVGGAILVLALGFALHAARLLRDAGRMPRRSAASIRRDVETLQTMVTPDATS